MPLRFTSACLALLMVTVSASPLLAQDAAQTNDGPISTNVSGIKSQLLHTPQIEDAPKDDFGKVAWCHGALSGHMMMAERISAVEPLSKDMQAIGQSYLRAYEAALTLSKDGKTEKGRKRAELARQNGYDGWEEARRADLDKAVGAYVTWSLPGVCETAALNISGRPKLFSELQTEDEARIVTEALKPASERTALDVHQPKARESRVLGDEPPPAATSEVKPEPASLTAEAAPSDDRPSWADGLKSRLGWGKKKN
ncbi:hypothetical protein [Asticcacaulis machinosus]|uniref:Uncharacterized protein n=1 Tax=Asticcacaulis machinosus TaxID=2984211 RepID=A0ABT5HHY3_9CAUL|nr:hypothetical protein [Asticcacaulis machinosus]MDC7675853.1 hypothetical protein [Asticcacaulis machinosus]